MSPGLKPTLPGRRLIREPELLEKLGGVSGMTVRRWEQEGWFPRRFKINPTGGPYSAVAWFEDEVDEIIEARGASRDAAA